MDKNSDNVQFPYLAVSSREKVAGKGPTRQLLPSFLQLGKVCSEIMSLAKAKIDPNAPCECGTDFYPMSHGHPLKKLFGDDYVQLLLQHPASDGISPRDYTKTAHPIIEPLRRSLNGMHFFRARLNKLPVGGVAAWHIDTNTSVACRLQLMIQGACTWSIKRGGVIEQKTIRAGEVWFANTGFPHQVENIADVDRWVLIVDCDYHEIAKAFGEFVFAEARK